MERKIGEKFSFLGITLLVEEASDGHCEHCYIFDHALPCCNKAVVGITGQCSSVSRKDGKNVVFMEN